MMDHNEASAIDQDVRQMLDKHKAKIKLSLNLCAHCALCAESCFLFNSRKKDPKYMPSYKFINSIGKLFKKKGKVSKTALEEISENAFKRCVLCTRCYCPFGIDIPSMIGLARSICRLQGVYPQFDEEPSQKTSNIR